MFSLFTLILCILFIMYKYKFWGFVLCFLFLFFCMDARECPGTFTLSAQPSFVQIASRLQDG